MDYVQRLLFHRKGKKPGAGQACAGPIRQVIGDYCIKETISSGSQGVIKLVWRIANPEPMFALKQYLEQDEYSQTEISILRKCFEMKHANVMSLIDVFTRQGQTCVIMEYAEKGDLSNYLHNHGRLKLTEKVELIHQCASGLNYIHEMIHTIHRDIKPGNIVMKSCSVPESGVIAKITDFGMAKMLDSGVEEISDLVGTMTYWAPEFFYLQCREKSHYDKTVDVFSMGLVYLCIMRNKEDPYSVGENKRLKNFSGHSKDTRFYRRFPVGQQIQQGEDPKLLVLEKNENSTERELKNLILEMIKKVDKREKLSLVHDKLKKIKDKLHPTTSSKLYPALVVAAMEISPSTTYGFSFISSPDNVFVNKNWPDAILASYHVPTVVLTDDNDQFLEFGHSAERRYSDDAKKDKNLHLFRFEVEMLSEGVDFETITSVDGHKCDAYKIYMMVLTYLKKHMISAIESRISSSLTDDDIFWVIVIPSVWGLKGKKYLTDALTLNREYEEISFTRKMLLTDMEASAMHCLYSNVPKLSAARELKEGDQFIILYARDSHSDVCVYSRGKDDQVTEIKTSLIPKGQNAVTEKFTEMLGSILGNDFIDHLRTESPSTWECLLSHFSRGSKWVASHMSPRGMNIPVSWTVGSLHQQFRGTSFQTAIKESSNAGVKFSNDFIVISPDTVKDIFKPVHELVIVINQYLAIELFGFSKAKAIFLVGSFGQSKYLQEVVRVEFGQRLSIIIPDDGNLVALKGAVEAGHRFLRDNNNV